MPEWFSACGVAEIPAGRGRTIEVSGLRVALYLHGGSVVALSDRCPHQGGSLGQGWVEDGEAVCPLHRWRFKLGDGRCATMRGNSVHRFPVEVREEMVWIRI